MRQHARIAGLFALWLSACASAPPATPQPERGSPPAEGVAEAQASGHACESASDCMVVACGCACRVLPAGARVRCPGCDEGPVECPPAACVGGRCALSSDAPRTSP
jgi:hypothetical protein